MAAAAFDFRKSLIECPLARNKVDKAVWWAGGRASKFARMQVSISTDSGTPSRSAIIAKSDWAAGVTAWPIFTRDLSADAGFCLLIRSAFHDLSADAGFC